jgi:large subunit ribosomal protein L24
MARHIKSGDTVMVTSGNDKGKTGKVLKVLTKQDKVIVEGLNIIFKHVRPSQRNPQGGRIRKEAPMAISKVLPIDPTSGKATRVRFRKEGSTKQRLARSGTVLSTLSR